MIKQAIVFLLIAAVVLRPSHGMAEGARSWQEYFFDGKEFREGASSLLSSVYIKDGYVPVIKTESVPLPEDRLPAGTGALVIFCYVQTTGGKLQSHSGYVPMAGAAIEIRNSERTMATRSDGKGYFVLALPAGQYDIQVRGFTRKALVEKGKTVFVMIRAGKGMVD